MIIHKEKHPLAGKKIKIRKQSTHLQVPDFGGAEFELEDWWDHLTGSSWMEADGNLAALTYAMRSVMNDLPLDNEVVYGHIGHYGHIVHVNELEIEK